MLLELKTCRFQTDFKPVPHTLAQTFIYLRVQGYLETGATLPSFGKQDSATSKHMLLSACGPNARLPPSGAPQRPHGRGDGGAPCQWRCSSRWQALPWAAHGPRQHSRAPMGARLWTASWTLVRTQGPADCPCGPEIGPRVGRWQRNK